MFKMKSLPRCILLCLSSSLAFSVGAAELPSGTVLSKDNIDKIKNDTFQGHTIASLLTVGLDLHIRKFNLKMTLTHNKPWSLDPKSVAATKKYSGQVKFDPATREATGYVAGIPFPDVSPTDPFAGDKLMWNVYLANPEGGTVTNTCAYIYIDGNKGIDKITELYFQRYYMKNRIDRDKPVEGDGSALSRTLIVFTAPYDMRGLSIFAIRYDVPNKLEDNWVYVKSVRRTRRLSGSSWYDPVGGGDQLNDDLYIWNARPSFYSKVKLIGKRWILAPTEGTSPRDLSKKGTPDEFPAMDMKNPPYYNPVQTWQPREVYAIEGTPPEAHPYGKKVVYVDVNIPWINVGEAYDKKGEFWKSFVYATRQVTAHDGITYHNVNLNMNFDFKANHSTTAYCTLTSMNNNLTANDVSLQKLESDAK